MALVQHLPGYLGRRGQLPLIVGLKPRMGFTGSLGLKGASLLPWSAGMFPMGMVLSAQHVGRALSA